MEKQTIQSRRRSFCALCLALLMTLGVLPMQAWADWNGIGDGGTVVLAGSSLTYTTNTTGLTRSTIGLTVVYKGASGQTLGTDACATEGLGNFDTNGSGASWTIEVKQLDNDNVTLVDFNPEVHTATQTRWFAERSGNTVTLTLTGVHTVIYNANGGTGTMANQTVTAFQATVLENGFTRDGYTFMYWSTTPSGSGRLYKANEDTVDFETAGDTVTLYAIWAQASELYDITADLETKYNHDIHLELWRGNCKLAETDVTTLTNAGNGKFTASYKFERNLNGIYNLVATQSVPKGEFTGATDDYPDNVALKMTAAVEVKNAHATKTVKMPETQASSELQVNVGEPLVIGGIDEVAELFGTSNFYAGQYATTPAAVKNVTMTVNMVGPGNNTEGAADAKVPAGATNVETFTFSVDLAVENFDGTSAAITDLSNTDLFLEIIVPIDNLSANGFAISREHGGVVDELPQLPLTARPAEPKSPAVPGEGWFYDATNHLLFVYLNKFSDLTVKAYTAPVVFVPVIAVTTYQVNVLDSANGTITSNYQTAAAGTTVTLTVKPDEAYLLENLVVTDKNGNVIELTDKGEGMYTFVMPAADVEAAGSFVLPEPEADPFDAFTDLDKTAWYREGVKYALENGIMSGMGDGLFVPNGTTTRAQLAMILWNLEGRPAAEAASFTDVRADDWFAGAVDWAAANKVIGGYGDGTFGPNDPLTREQLVTILYRYAQFKGVDVSVGEDTNILSYNDVAEVSEWAIPAFQWAVGSGAVTGKTESTLNPKDTATRAEIATLIMRYCTQIVK